jgi:hypothetical protein
LFFVAMVNIGVCLRWISTVWFLCMMRVSFPGGKFEDGVC